MAETKDHEKKLKGYVGHFSSKEQKKLGAHFKHVELKLEDIVKKGEKDPHAVADEMAKQYYKGLNYDMTRHDTRDKRLGYLMVNMGQKNYGEFMDMLEEGDIEEAAKLLKEGHRKHFTSNVNQVKLAEIERLEKDEKEGMASAIKAKYKPQLGHLSDAEVVLKLPALVQLHAQAEDQIGKVGGIPRKEYAAQMKELYEAGRPKKKAA